MGYEYEPDGTINEFPYLDPAIDEDGDYVECGICDRWLKYNPKKKVYFCPYCHNERMTRKEYFNAIGANGYVKECMTCRGNYPLCKEDCYRGLI